VGDDVQSILEVQDDRSFLKEIEFTDLYLSEGTDDAKMRGLVDIDDPIYPVAIDDIIDLGLVRRKVIQTGQSENEFVLDHDEVRYRVSKIPSDSGINWYALRRAMHPIPRLRRLLAGVSPYVIQELGRIGKHPNRGMILLAGATGAGKTTTICSLLQEYLQNYGDVATTIEDPPELKLDGSYRNGAGQCFQVKVQNGDFATPLRSALRYQPRYILLGEIRDPEGASESLRAAISGHIVLATIHSGTIPEAITAMMKLVSSRLEMELARSMLADGLAAVMHQEMKRVKTTDGRVERRVILKTLFLGDTMNTSTAGARNKIREGKAQGLVDDIEAQANRMLKQQPPIMISARQGNK
jgi:twitching motility protein PilT